MAPDPVQGGAEKVSRQAGLAPKPQPPAVDDPAATTQVAAFLHAAPVWGSSQPVSRIPARGGESK